MNVTLTATIETTCLLVSIVGNLRRRASHAHKPTEVQHNSVPATLYTSETPVGETSNYNLMSSTPQKQGFHSPIS
jgi:hypothetical protein